MESQVNKYKLVFLGDIRVGKTCIINRFVYDTFENDYHPTIGIDFVSKTLNLDDRTVRLQLWDTAGQERFRSLIPSYIRDSLVALIVFDLTNRQTFDNTKSWIEQVKNERGNDVIMVLVGNKIDDYGERCVTSEEAAAKATDLGAIYIEVSARSGVNITNLFNQIVGWLATRENAIDQNEDGANTP